MILDIRRRHGPGTDEPLQAAPPIEELFLFTDPATGVKDVWFRNYSVVANLKIRSAMGADPESVAWGPDGTKFVVRAGPAGVPSSMKYHVFGLNRKADTALQPKKIPKATLLRTESPAQSALVLYQASVTLSTKTQSLTVVTLTNAHLSLSTDGTFCITNIDGLSVPFSVTTGTEDHGSAVQAITLGTIMASGSPVVRYGLNAAGDLILLVVGTPVAQDIAGGVRDTVTMPAELWPFTHCDHPPVTSTTVPTTLTLFPRSGERHLWVVNHTAGTVLYRSTASAPVLNLTSFGAGNAVLAANHVIITPAALCSPVTIDGCGYALPPGGNPPGTIFFDVNYGVHDNGFKVLQDTLWDPAVPFLSEFNYSPTFADTADRVPLLVVAGPNDGSAEYDRVGTQRQWTLDNPFTYAILDVFLVSADTPVKFLVVVQRQRVNGTARANGLFLLDASGSMFKQLQPFIAEAPNFFDLTVFSTDAAHALWALRFNDGVNFLPSQIFISDLATGASAQVGTTFATFQSENFRALAPDLLYDTKETDRNKPAGFFVHFFDKKTRAITLSETAKDFPTPEPALKKLGTLAKLPATITPPVAANLFGQDFQALKKNLPATFQR